MIVSDKRKFIDIEKRLIIISIDCKNMLKFEGIVSELMKVFL